jgi:ketosteroid isomerase-like protein
MSEENVEIVRRAYEALFDRRDRDEYASLLHPEVELVRARDALEQTADQGVAGLERWIGEWEAVFHDFHVRAEQFHALGDQVVVAGRARGTMRASDVELRERWAHVWTVKNGLVTRIQSYVNEKEALEAAGLSE